MSGRVSLQDEAQVRSLPPNYTAMVHQGSGLRCASKATWWLWKTFIHSTSEPFVFISQFVELSPFQALNMRPPVCSNTISKTSCPCILPFIKFPCSSKLSWCIGAWCWAMCSKALCTVGMARKILASSRVPAYFSAPNHNDSLPAASKKGPGSKRSSVALAASTARKASGLRGFSKLATKPATLQCRGRPPTGTLNSTTSLEPVDHSTPRSRRSQAWPLTRSMRPGTSSISRCMWKNSWSATKTVLLASGPPSATTARMPSRPLARRQGTWHSYAQPKA
mmetsp:Transcript_72490/g.212465  ORF Transcript_72490/g.212465 Transcript_72490/m.212465 type:complete len:279 (-) Transcript_72490:1910-2746(-)